MEKSVKYVHSEKSEKKVFQEVFARGLRSVKPLGQVKVPMTQRVSQDVLDASKGVRSTSVRL